MNLNKLAQKVTLLEGQKKSQSIAQVKEVMRLLCIELSKKLLAEANEALKKARDGE